MFRAPPPERHRRGDRVAAAVIVVALAVAAVVVATTGDAAGTTSRPAAAPIAEPLPATGAPGAFVEAWRTPSRATTAPVLAGPAAVTADGGTVTGHDARTGEASWSYTRTLPLCAVGSGFPATTPDPGRVLALYGDGPLDAPGTWCSELTMLAGDTGERVSARNPDARPGTQLVADDTYVVSTGTDHLEAWRYDLVRTVEYGQVPAQEQADRQPRPDCTYGSTAQDAGRTAVVERCPGENADRLTVLVTAGKSAEEPEVVYSVLLPGRGAQVVATGTERTAVVLPGPDRIVVFDAAGAAVGATEVDLGDRDLTGAVAVTSVDDRFRYWWSGEVVVALDLGELSPVWTLPFALGPPVRYGSDLLVPVREGLRVLDAERGEPGRTIPVSRADPAAPVRSAAQGDVLLEQRGPEIVAMVPG